MKNTGNVTLTGPLSVADDHIGSPATPFACGSSALAPNASETCTATYAITQADLDAGSVTNNATASSNGITSPTVSATVTAVQTVTLALTKTGAPATYGTVGQVITYTYIVTNTGNVTLHGPFTVTDDKLSVTCPATASLVPGSVTCTAAYTIAQGDLDAGLVTNHATASNGPVTSAEVQATVTANVNPSLKIAKSANPSTYSVSGQAISYSYEVTNTGNVTVSGPLQVSDDKLGTLQCGTASALAPGATVTCGASYTTQASDIGNVISLPAGTAAAVYTGGWLQGLDSTLDTSVSGAGPGVPDGIYAGWSIQDHVNGSLHNEPGTLYASNGSGLPDDVVGRSWGKINYVLNHKIRGSGKPILRFSKTSRQRSGCRWAKPILISASARRRSR